MGYGTYHGGSTLYQEDKLHDQTTIVFRNRATGRIRRYVPPVARIGIAGAWGVLKDEPPRLIKKDTN